VVRRDIATMCGVDRLLQIIIGLPPAVVLAMVFLLPALESSTFLGLVVPGEIAVVLGGVVAHGGALPLWAVAASAVIGATVGDQVGYLVGRRYGAGLLKRVPRRLAGPDELERARGLIRSRGAAAVVIARWVALLRALVPGVAGISGMRHSVFTAANVAGALFWAVGVSILGYLAGASYQFLETRLRIGGEALLAVFVVLLVRRIWRRSQRARHRT
jgi:membrane-associated protein